MPDQSFLSIVVTGLTMLGVFSSPVWVVWLRDRWSDR